MARIDFAFGAQDRLRTTCEVVRKHYLRERPMLVYCGQAQFLDRFDRLLWSFEPDAFIAHVDANDPLARHALVLLTTEPPQPAMHAPHAAQKVWLINLGSTCPPNAEQFERILEIVSLNQDDIEPARQRWLQYKAAGHDLHAHNISTAQAP